MGPASATDAWFLAERTNSFVATLIVLLATLGSVWLARSGREIFIRRIAGLSAIDEAIGRAAEMGKKVLFVPGVQGMEDSQTVASMAILGYVARATARYGTDLEVVNRDTMTLAAAREAVRGGYRAEGRPDLYREEMVRYVAHDQYAYAAAVAGKMVRERTAANFLIGRFQAESLIMAETGRSTGAIQIAGMADPTQLPFFVATCDYTLIGEELYAASAYLSRDRMLLGSVRAQDILKAICIAISVAGVVAASAGIPWISRMLETH